MEGGECSEEVKLYLFAAELEGNPPSVFYLANPQEKVEPGDVSISCQSLFESDRVPSLEPKNAVLKFMKTSNLIESVELELTAGQDQNLHNLELVINPSKETVILTTYDTPDGSKLWRSTNIYSMVPVPVLASANSSSKEFMAHCDDNESLPVEIGGTDLSYRGNISKVSFYPLSIDFTRDFIVTRLLGEGARGTVYKCTRGSLQFAIKKTYRVSRNSPSTEVDAMIRLSGTNHVVQIYAAWYEESSEFSHSYIAMELFERTLEDYLAERNETNMEKSTKMFTEIMSGVHAIHQKGIIHRDIKPMNILVDNNEHISITDFDMAEIKPHPAARYAGHEMYGTRYYCDPVLNLEHVQHDEKVDIYSCGIIYFEMHLPKVTQRMSMVRKFSDKWKYNKKDKKYNFWNSSLWTDWGGSKDIMKDLVTPLYRPDSSYFLDKLRVISQRAEDKEVLE